MIILVTADIGLLDICNEWIYNSCRYLKTIYWSNIGCNISKILNVPHCWIFSWLHGCLWKSKCQFWRGNCFSCVTAVLYTIRLLLQNYCFQYWLIMSSEISACWTLSKTHYHPSQVKTVEYTNTCSIFKVTSYIMCLCHKTLCVISLFPIGYKLSILE